MRNIKIESISIVLASFLLGGCVSLAPDYERPNAPVPSTWKIDVKEKTPNTQALAWEAFIRDERLQSVIRQSLEQSRDLRKAIANIEAARATYRVQRSAELPTIEASASGSKARTVTTNNSTAITQSSSATLGISNYELDFFGKARNSSETEFETYKGVEEAERLVRLTLIAETTSAWLSYASDQSLLSLSKQTELSAKRSFELVQKRVELGIDSNVSLYSVQSIFQQAKADVASYTTKVAQDLAALELLVGASVDETRLPTGLESTSQR
ncbi:MAG: TolC family protein [Candidatus Cloacimonetes bacterium]|nr:TolC family protein [Candidatus Cloacimonadota bacterium]